MEKIEPVYIVKKEDYENVAEKINSLNEQIEMLLKTKNDGIVCLLKLIINLPFEIRQSDILHKAMTSAGYRVEYITETGNLVHVGHGEKIIKLESKNV